MKGEQMKLMWRTEHVGNVTETGRDMPDCYGKFELATANEKLIAYIRARGTDHTLENRRIYEEFDQEFLEEMLDGWTLVRPDGSVVSLVTSPSISLDTHIICWNEIHAA